jgi:hypothetical protein
MNFGGTWPQRTHRPQKSDVTDFVLFPLCSLRSLFLFECCSFVYFVCFVVTNMGLAFVIQQRQISLRRAADEKDQ